MRDIWKFVEKLREMGEICEIDVPCDSELEIAEIADRVVKNNGPALLFNNVKGSDIPLLVGAFANEKRMELALKCKSLSDIAVRIEKLFELLGAKSPVEAAIKLAQRIDLLGFFPCVLPKPICWEGEVNLSRFPILKCYPADGGRFITMGLTTIKSLDGDCQNTGLYRLQVFDNNTLGMHFHRHKDAAAILKQYKELGHHRIETAVTIGCDPAIIYAATAPLPFGLDEIKFAGFLKRRPIKMFKSDFSNLLLPASFEIIIEGYIDPFELRLEGPFGDHTGYYSAADMYPVFHGERMLVEKKPLFMATVTGKPPKEDLFLGLATERIFVSLAKLMCPLICDWSFPQQGVFHGAVFISIKKPYPGAAAQVANFIWGTAQLCFSKLIVLVDQDIDPSDDYTVLWRVFNNVDWSRDTILQKGPLDVLDHSSPQNCFGSKLCIDATRKSSEENGGREWPCDAVQSEQVRQLVQSRWKSYGIM